MPNSSDESFAWTVRLSDSAPWKRFVILAVAVTAGVLGIVLLGQLLLGLLAFAIILAATAEFWLGVTFRISPKGASARVGPSLTHIDWTDVKRVISEGTTIRLSPLAEEGRLAPFRGVALRTTVENHERVLDAVRSNCSDDVRFLGF